jgi:D-alanine-D-alanine ligase
MARADRLNVVVLTGGTSAEREVCLMSGNKVLRSLDPARYESRLVDLADIVGPAAGALPPAQGRPVSLPAPSEASAPRAEALARYVFAPSVSTGQAIERDGKPDVVFIALHGGPGENGTVQGLLDLLGIPYTGSGVLASALGLNKVVSKRLFEHAGIPTPKWVPLRAAARAEAAASVREALDLPCVIKPAQEGSSLGVTIVRAAEELEPALDLAFSYGPEALAEEFIAGTEITGPVLGNDDPQVLPLVEIVPASGFYDYHAKYTPGATEEIVPARIPEERAQRARALTLAAHRLLGCRGMSRVDMIVGADDVYVLELQTIPGLTETSLLPRSAAAAGISFEQLVDRLIALALER